MPSSYTPLPTSPVGFEKNGNLLAPESNYTLDNNCQHNTKGVMPSIEIANVTTDVCTEITPPRLSWDTTRNETQGSVQLWKLLKTYSRNELELMSLQELQITLGSIQNASQAASMCLVSELQCRHGLQEEADVRNVAIEQLLRRAEKYSSSFCNPPSPLMTGRG